MKLCVSNWSLQEELSAGRMDIAGFFEFCEDNEIDRVELLGDFVNCSIKELKNMLAERGLTLCAWSALNNFLVPEGAALDGQIDRMRASIDEAYELNARVLRVFSGDADDVPHEKGLQRIIRTFRLCAPYAEAAGVVMALENHGVFAGRSEQILRILKEVDSTALKTTLDPSNYIFVDEDPAKAAMNVLGRVAHVHAKDYRLTREGDGPYSWPTVSGAMYSCVPIGKGSVDWKAIIEALRSSGYDGCLSIEYEGANPVEGTAESIQALRVMI